MSDSLQFLADAAPKVDPEKDRYGRYLIVPADGGKAVPHTRMTTFIKAVDGGGGDALRQWYARYAVKGVLESEAMSGRVSTWDADPADKETKKEFNRLLDDATVAVGINEKRDKGSALHDATELVDAGKAFTPAKWMRAPLEQYVDVVRRFGLVWTESEEIVVLDDFTIAGRFDRLVRAPWFPGTRVLDIKTGSVDYPAKFCVQLGGYSIADAIYDPATATRRPMPDDIDKNVALVLHLPIDGSPAKLYRLDIGPARRIAELCKSVRSWNNQESRGILAELDAAKMPGLDVPEVVKPDAVISPAAPAVDPFADVDPFPPSGTPNAPAVVEATAVETPAPHPPGAVDPQVALDNAAKLEATFPGAELVTVDRLEWSLERVELIKGIDGGLAVLRKWWPVDGPTPGELRRGERAPTDAELSAIISCVVKAGDEAGVPDDPAWPWGPPDPLREVAAEPELEHGIELATTPTGDANAEEAAAVKAHLVSLDLPRQELVKRWLGQAARKGVGFAFIKTPDERRLCIGRSAIVLADEFYDHDAVGDGAAGFVHAALDVIVEDGDRAPVGVRLGRLSHDQAKRLLELVKDAHLSYGVDGVPIVEAVPF